MAEPLTTVERVAARAAIPMPLSETEAALAHEVIAIASGLVRHAGLPWKDIVSAPDIATAICTEASARAFMNPSGLTSERADTVAAGRHEVQASGVHLTTQERETLQAFRPGSGTLLSAPTVDEARPVPVSALAGHRVGPRHVADYRGRFVV